MFYKLDYRASAILHRYFLKFDVNTEIILPVNICPIVEEVALKSGLKPIYFDISENYDYTIEQNEVIDYLERSEKKERIILLNHTYGVDFLFNSFCRKLKYSYDITIIEDFCLSIPIISNSEFVDLSLYSFGYSKYVQLVNGGGLGVSNEKFNLPSPKYFFEKKTNFEETKLDSLFEKIKNDTHKVMEHKVLINNIYNKELLTLSMGDRFNSWRFNVKVKNKEKVLSKIFEKNLFASSHYKPLKMDKNKFKEAWDLYDSIINLFNDKNIIEDQALEIAKIINKYAKV